MNIDIDNTEDQSITLQNMIVNGEKYAKLTRLVAEENIHFEYSTTATTASYSPDRKLITMPYSVCLNDEDMHIMFLFHEASHALHADADVLHRLINEAYFGNFKEEFNVVEDIRIERLMKKRYPGAVVNFNRAYAKLLEKNFFGDPAMINVSSFSSRLNVYAKCGPIAGAFIKFSPDEIEFYNRCMKAETIEDTFALTKELCLTYTSENTTRVAKIVDRYIDEEDEDGETVRELFREILHKRASYMGSGVQEKDDEGDTDTDVFDEKYVFREEDKEIIAEEIEKFHSQYEFDSALKSSLLNQCSIISYKPASKDIVRKVIPVSKIADKTNNEIINKRVRAYRESVRTMIDGMAKEFESRKAAYRAKNAKISDTGLINVNRLVNYQFSDDIFATSIKVADGKNHAFVILLDCSGSIMGMFENMANQVIVLTEFFRKINVKFVVYGYGCEPNDSVWDEDIYTQPKIESHSFQNYVNRDKLVEFVNSDMKTNEYNASLAAMKYKRGWVLGGTPTITAMSVIEHTANEFFKKHRIDIKKVINITDGEPHDVARSFSHDYSNGLNTIAVTDPMTKKVYTSNRYRYAAVDMMGAIWKDRYGIDLISISIFGRYGGEARAFCNRNITDAERGVLRKEKFLQMVSPSGNNVFLVYDADVQNGLDAMDIDGDTSVRDMTKVFTKTLSKNKKSRNFLNILAKFLSIQ